MKATEKVGKSDGQVKSCPAAPHSSTVPQLSLLLKPQHALLNTLM